MDLSTVVTLAANGLALGAVLFLLASGLTLIFGLLDVPNFSHGALFMLGAYVAVVVQEAWGVLAAFVVATVSVAAVGLAFERVLLRRFYHAESRLTAHLRQLLLTLGIALVLTELIRIVKGPNFISVRSAGWINDTVNIGGGYVQAWRLALIAIGAIVFLAALFVMQRTRVGLIIRAGVQDSDMVQSLGINVNRAFMLVFTVGAGLAGFAGAASAYLYRGVYPTMGEEHLVLAFGIVVMAGLGSYAGSALGAVLVGLASSFVSYFWLGAQSFVVVGLLVVVLLIRPNGLFNTEVTRV